MQLKISEINFYPIKSCAGISLSSGEISARGLKYDRQWMLVDLEGRFITQREQPRMSLVKVVVDNSGNLFLSAPAVPSLEVPETKKGLEQTVVVWKDSCLAVDQGADAARWFSEFLQYPCRLVRMKDDWIRPVDKDTAPDDGLHPVGFADGYPFLLISEASLDDLNSKLEAPVLMNRFRPNLVVSGAEPFAEDSWRRIAINGLRFAIVKPCSRCVITTIDQEFGEKGKEPLRTLSGYRKFEGKVNFGQNLVHLDQGIIKLGDSVELLD